MRSAKAHFVERGQNYTLCWEHPCVDKAAHGAGWSGRQIHTGGLDFATAANVPLDFNYTLHTLCDVIDMRLQVSLFWECE